MTRLRIAIAVAVIAALAALFSLVRPEDEQGTAPRAVDVTTATTHTATAPMRERPKISEIAIRDGRPIGGPLSARAREGELVELRVYADVIDDVHVHGYDLTARVTPTSFARLRFRATITGRFEVELERRHVPIGRLIVVP